MQFDQPYHMLTMQSIRICKCHAYVYAATARCACMQQNSIRGVSSTNATNKKIAFFVGWEKMNVHQSYKRRRVRSVCY